MTSLINRQWKLVRRPVGMVATRDFEYVEGPAPAVADDQCLVRTLYVSFDPAMRAFLHHRPSYVPPQPIGEVMRAGAVGQASASRSRRSPIRFEAAVMLDDGAGCAASS